MGTAFVGLIVLLGVNPVSIVSIDPWGLACMLAATFCYALGFQLSKRLLGGLSMYQITFATLLWASLGSGGMAFAVESVALPHLASPENIAVTVGLGVFGSGIAYILFYFMIQKGSPEFATMVTYLVPATAIIWGYTLLNEQLSWSLLMGLVLILGGVFLASNKVAGVRATRLEMQKSRPSQ